MAEQHGTVRLAPIDLVSRDRDGIRRVTRIVDPRALRGTPVFPMRSILTQYAMWDAST